jgi:hypothetical protein
MNQSGDDQPIIVFDAFAMTAVVSPLLFGVNQRRATGWCLHGGQKRAEARVGLC